MYFKKSPLKKLNTKAKHTDYAPSFSYDTQGRVRRRSLSKKARLILLCSILLFFCVAAIAAIYMPQLFLADDGIGSMIAAHDPQGWTKLQSHLIANGHLDYDRDGINNASELGLGSNPFFQDTDNDGIADGLDANILKYDKTLEKAVKATGATRKTPYTINGVILWPDTNDAWVRGGVIKTQTGYQFQEYVGWAKFPEKGIAYQYADGKHTPLSYREEADAYHIKENCLVVIVPEAKEMTYRISFIGKEKYSRTKFGAFLADILPDKGWLTAEAMWLDDTFIDTNRMRFNQYKVEQNPPDAENRYTMYTNRLPDLAAVYNLIDDGYCVWASLMSQSNGEMIVVIYGYVDNGDLLICDPMKPEQEGVLRVQAHCVRSLDGDSKVSLFEYFTIQGCGYTEDALIAFYAATKAE